MGGGEGRQYLQDNNRVHLKGDARDLACVFRVISLDQGRLVIFSQAAVYQAMIREWAFASLTLASGIAWS